MFRGDRTAAERKMPLSRPAAGGESCFAGFFLIRLSDTFFAVLGCPGRRGNCQISPAAWTEETEHAAMRQKDGLKKRIDDT